uniref:Cytoplasmic dynein 2 heavy chain 1 n=1 Tax=Bursaphelenchus xylophilus TaxID=6326 RepID=A0A1I7SEA2_BURXY
MSDSRRTYILRIASHLVSLNLNEEKLPNVECLKKFCDTNEQNLVISRTDNKGHVEVVNDPKTASDTHLYRVVFYKSQPNPLSAENFKKEIEVLTVNNSNDSNALLGTVRQVFGDIGQIEANVTNGNARNGTSNADFKQELKRLEQTYGEIVEPLVEKYDQINQMTLPEVAEFVETAEYVVDGLWTTTEGGFSQTRMTNLLDMIVNEICSALSSRLAIPNFWTDPSATDLLETSISICTQWQLSVKLLTGQNWPNISNEWKGGELNNKSLERYKQRLIEVQSIRRLIDQLGRMKEGNGLDRKLVDAINSIIGKENLLKFGEKDGEKVEEKLKRVEQVIDENIKTVLPQIQSKLAVAIENMPINAVTLIYKYREILSRPGVRSKLQSIRESLFTRITEYFRSKRNEFEDGKRNGSLFTNSRYLTEIGAKVVWVRSNMVQFQQIEKVCNSLFNDLSSYAQFDRDLKNFMGEIKKFEAEQFDEWCKDILAEIDDPNNSIALQTTGRLMKLDKEKGILTANYSDRLVGLLREVGQLSSLGFNVPRQIQQCTRTAEQFYRYGNVLKQVAHFYNTIEQQMLPCQQAMMLEEALRFDRLVMPKGNSDGNNVTWDNPKKLQEYIEELQKAATALTTHNRQLRKAHMEICSRVLKILESDFLKDTSQWNSVVAAVRKVFADEEQRVANPANMRPWAIHWDKQLFKVLQLHFHFSIQNVHTLIGPVHVQLVLRDHALTLRPSLHETKMKFYADLQKFFTVPAQLMSVQTLSNKSQSPFATIPLLNVSKFPQIYQNLEKYFDELSRVCDKYEEWEWMSNIDLEELVAEEFTQSSQWEKQLVQLRARQRKADEIENELTIGPIVVSLMSFKNSLNSMLRRMNETLNWTLKNSINQGIQTLSSTIKRGTDLLAVKPQTMQDIGETSKNYITLKKDLPLTSDHLNRLNEQNSLLRRWTGAGVTDLNEVSNEFEKYKNMLEMFDDVIKEQVDNMKANIADRIKQLANDAELVYAHWKQFKPTGDVLMAENDVLTKNVEFIRECQKKYDGLMEQYESLRDDCEKFELPKVEISIMEQMRNDLGATAENYRIYEEFDTELKKLGETEWILFRNKAYLFDEFLQEWTNKLKQLPVNPIVVRLQRQIEQMADFSAALKFCRGESLSAQHWTEMFRLLQLPRGTLLEQLTFNDLIGVRENVVKNVDGLKELSSRAQGEAAIRDALQELELWAAQAEFVLSDYRHSNGQTIKIVKEWKEPMYQVKDNQTLLMSLKNSTYYTQFKDQTSVWEKRIADLEVYLQLMMQIQRKWVYLEPIFGRGALPAERARFQRADAEFRSILHDLARNPRLVHLANEKSLARSLDEISDQLGRCQRALNDFLEVKRVAFPRFYFLGDDDLLEILGQSTNPTVIQNHLKKLFQGIERVVFDAEKKTIRGIISPENENVSLMKPVTIVADVENYLKSLVDEIRATLKKLLFDCLAESNLDPSRYPTQIICLAEEIRFTRDLEEVLGRNGDLNKFKKDLEDQLEQFTTVTTDDSLMDLKLKSLILDIIHHIKVVEQLISSKDKSISSWTWQKQIRFYLKGQDVLIKHVNAEIQYTYEYQGCAAKLVHTPLTDKCYLTLTQALSLGLGGNPFGPAGTGKTESVKALGNLFGRQVLVFNCDEGIDVQAIGRMFIGLIQCGAWGCFDEFNRLDKDVLSAVSSQIQTLQDAIKNRSSTCQLNNRNVNVDFNAAIFVTLNPVGKGYGGRQKLPDNLKQLFRPVVMSKPNNEEISETLLFAEGFKKAKLMANKIVTAFDMSRDLLSNQQHYDWGLRSMKTVLKGCGSALAKVRGKSEVDEEKIVLQTLMLSTLSKLTFTDFKRFNALLKDVFPGVDAEVDQFADLTENVAKSAEKSNLELTNDQITKIIELNEQLSRRIGVVIVGPPGSGKSTLWLTLKSAMEKMGTGVGLYTVNPKAMPKTKFLGEMNLDTREWTDGVLTSVAREVVKDPAKRAWIVCDGDVDPDWIEALNSVLDDNKLLTMPTGERIQFGDNVNFIFETDDLRHASPATISRMGMIYISDEIVSIASHIKRLCKIKEIRPEIADWLNETLPEAIKWVLRHSDQQVSRVAIVENVVSQTYDASNIDEFKVGLLRGLLPYVSMESFTALANDVVFQGQHLPNPANPLNVHYDKQSMSLQSFSDDSYTNVTLNDMKYEEKRPTILTARMKIARDTVAKWLQEENRESFCVLGPDGSGKDQLLRGSFAEHYKSALVRLNCGARTSALDIMDLLTRNCVQTQSAAGRSLRPKDKDHLIVYLKSIDLIQQDKYGSSMTISFLEDVLHYHGFYDSNNDWTFLENVQLVCTFAHPPSAGRSLIPPRFICSSKLMFMDPPVDEELIVLASAYLQPIIGDQLGSSSRVEAFAASLVQTYKRIKDQLAAATQTHYDFSTRDLINWILSFMRYGFTAENIATLLPLASAFEANCIFVDRLINFDHRNECQHIINETFRIGKESIFAPIPGAFQWRQAVMGKPLESIQKQEYIAQLNKGINRFEFEVSSFPYVLSEDLLALCLSLDRTLTLSGGHIFMAGYSDRMNRAAASLISHLHGLRIFSPKVSSNYSLKNFCNDLKQAITYVALESEPAVFILEDCQILEETSLQYINQILSTGTVPGLFTGQEFEQMTGQLRELASADSFDGELAEFFAYKIKRNLHVIVILDIEQSNFGQRLQTNPSLYKFCSVIWRIEPDSETLKQVVKMSLEQAQLPVRTDHPDLLYNLYNKSPPTTRIFPKFSVFVQNFIQIYKSKSTMVNERLRRLKAGVDKLNETREQVAKMQKKAAKKSKLLTEKQQEADNALAMITQSMTGAKEQRADMEQLRQVTEKESQHIEEQKKLIEEQLKDVEPLLKEARKAVGSIKSESLSEIRSLRAPPDAIRDILQAVLLFMGILDNSWDSMRRFLAKNGVKDEIINFDARNVTSDVRKRVQKVVSEKRNSFDEKVAKRASAAAAPLAAWVMANIEYSSILEKIQPLENEKNALLKQFAQTEKQMKSLSGQLTSVDKQVETLKKEFEESMKEATQIKVDLDREQAAIEVAGQMVERLGGEFSRWQTQMQSLEGELEFMDIHCALGAAFSTFLGIEAFDNREKVFKNWLEMCGLKTFDPVAFLTLEVDQQRWKTMGLPSTKMAAENAAIIFNSTETPFIIDSSGAISKFLSKLHQGKDCQVLKTAQDDFLTQVELGVRFGKVIIIDDIYNLDPALVNLLRKEFFSQGPRQVVQIGEKQIDVNENFKLYVCTRNEQLIAPGYVKNAVVMTNFSTTLAGLSSQILSLALNSERPDLEQQSVKLSSEAETLNIQLAEIEQTLLNELASSEGSLLENRQLLDSLNQSKESAEKAEESLATLEKVRKEIDEQKRVYLPFSEKCSMLYFSFYDLYLTNHMYNFNVGVLLQLFDRIFQKNRNASTDVQAKLDIIYQELVKSTFYYVSRALYKQDRLAFALRFVKVVHAKLFDDKEWNFFCGNLVDEAVSDTGSAPSWLSEEVQQQVAKLRAYLPSLYSQLGLEDRSSWTDFLQNNSSQLPGHIDQKLSNFQKVLVISILKPENATTAMTSFVTRSLQVPSINPPSNELMEVVQTESLPPNQPILLILGTGADPSQEIRDVAEKVLKDPRRLHELAMGNRRQNEAIELMRNAMEKGEWVYLNNVHLLPDFLLRIHSELHSKSPNPAFRLWLSAEPDNQFPAVPLQDALKIAYETPPGIKHNISGTLKQWIELEGNSGKSELELKTQFLLAWFHAIIQERRTYIPQGWLKFYEFNSNDLRVARQVLDVMGSKNGYNWEAIRGFMEDAIYGGRIENQLDIGVLSAYLDKFLSQKMVMSRDGELDSNLRMPEAKSMNEWLDFVQNKLHITVLCARERLDPLRESLDSGLENDVIGIRNVSRMNYNLFQIPEEDKPSLHLNFGVDRLQFVTSLSKIQSRAPSMQIGQLKIQGAVLGGGHLMAVDQNSAAISSAPVIHVAWIGMDEPEPYRQEESAEIPLFVASNRTEFVCQVKVPCSQGQRDQWVLAAVALFTRI